VTNRRPSRHGAEKVRALLDAETHDYRALKTANAELDEATQGLAVLLVERAMEESLSRRGLV
jgi:molecular chaperone DnaK